MSDEVKKDYQGMFSKKIVAGASSGLLGAATLLFTYIDSKIEASNQLVEQKYINMKQYVDDKHSNIEHKLSSIENLLVKIDDRIYELTKNKSKGE